METGMSDESLPGPSWDPESERAYYSRPYWEYGYHFGFPSYQYGDDDCGYEMQVWCHWLFSLNSAPTVILMLLPTPVIALCFQLASRVSICHSCLSNGSNVSDVVASVRLQSSYLSIEQLQLRHENTWQSTSVWQKKYCAQWKLKGSQCLTHDLCAIFVGFTQRDNCAIAIVNTIKA